LTARLLRDMMNTTPPARLASGWRFRIFRT